MKKISLAAAVAASVLFALFVSSPAQATPSTTLAFSKQAVTGYLDHIVLVVDGNPNISYSNSIAGCLVKFRDGVIETADQLAGLTTQDYYLYNGNADAVRITLRFYEASDCSGITFMSPYTASTYVVVQPELKIPTQTVIAGSENRAGRTFTTYAWNFGYGSAFSLGSATDCTSGSTKSGAMPSGLTISETAYSGGVRPSLIFNGTTSETGTYDVCVRLGLGLGQQFAWMRINVTNGTGAELASTGRDNRVILYTAGGSLAVVALASLGFWFASRRRRS
jgi:LPXTG-motif cell wall-anchored protein